MFKHFLENTGDFCSACMRGINYAIEVAAKAYSVPLIIKGSGRSVQYVSQIKELSSLNTATYFANVIKNVDGLDKFSHFAKNKSGLEFQKIIGGVLDVFGINRTKLMRFVPQHIGMYDYIYKPYVEIIKKIKEEMKWSDQHGIYEHLDCELHDIPFYRDTLRITNITKNTFYRSGLIRQGLFSREEALKLEEDELNSSDIPNSLNKFLEENDLRYSDYANYVKNSDNIKYMPRVQLLVREIYHKLRKF